MATLIIKRNAIPILRYPLNCSVIHIGRDDTSDIHLLGDQVSRQHATISPENGVYHFKNLGRNGTELCGRKIMNHQLKAGDTLRIADWELQFLLTDQAPNMDTVINSQKKSQSTLHSLIGNTSGIATLREQVSRMARTAAPICITGETGTGKEVVAHRIHQESARVNGSFVAVNCGAIPASMIESELFGYERGAFTGAIRDHRGFFEQANGGTIFLDEIAELPLELQTRFLRVLETGSFRRIGSQTTITADFRIICATHQNLRDAINNSSFREDLFFRLMVLPLHLSPLRERVSDIPLLVAHFSKLFGRASAQWSDAAMTKLMTYSWPGNVRELKNTIQRTLIMANGPVIEPADIFLLGSSAAAPAATGKLEDNERSTIVTALQRHKGNNTQAALTLGISRTTLIAKIKRFNIQSSEFR